MWLYNGDDDDNKDDKDKDKDDDYVDDDKDHHEQNDRRLLSDVDAAAVDVNDDNVNDDHDVNDDVGVQSNPGRADWAKSTCRIITDGHEFADCRKKVSDYQLYYKDCLYDTCGSVLVHYAFLY